MKEWLESATEAFAVTLFLFMAGALIYGIGRSLWWLVPMVLVSMAAKLCMGGFILVFLIILLIVHTRKD